MKTKKLSNKSVLISPDMIMIFWKHPQKNLHVYVRISKCLEPFLYNLVVCMINKTKIQISLQAKQNDKSAVLITLFELTFTSDFLRVLIMKRSSCDKKNTLPLFPGEESSRRVSLPHMDIM